MDLSLLHEHAAALFLHVTRVAAFVAVVQIFGRQADSLMLRLVLAVSLGAVFWWVGDQRVPMPPNAFALGVMAVGGGGVGPPPGRARSPPSARRVRAGGGASGRAVSRGGPAGRDWGRRARQLAATWTW